MIKRLLKFSPLLAYYIFSPVIVFAQELLPSRQVAPLSSASTCIANNQIGYFFCTVQGIINAVIPVLLALGVVYFIWGVVQYVIAGDEEAKTKGRNKIIYGIIGLTVIVSLWGLVYLVVNTFGLKSSAPTLQPINGSSSACNLVANPKFQDLTSYATCVMNNSIIPLIFGVAVVMFVWGVVQFVINGDDEAQKTKGKQFMIWGIIALTVMICIWGLVKILGSTLGLNTSILPQVKP